MKENEKSSFRNRKVRRNKSIFENKKNFSIIFFILSMITSLISAIINPIFIVFLILNIIILGFSLYLLFTKKRIIGLNEYYNPRPTGITLFIVIIIFILVILIDIPKELISLLDLVSILISGLFSLIGALVLTKNYEHKLRHNMLVKEYTDFVKNTLKFEKTLNIQVNKLMKNIKIVEGKVKELENMYRLLEKDELLKIKFENQNEKHQYQNYKLKLDKLKDFLQNLKKNYEESIKLELKILRTTKPRKLNRKIKRITKDIDHINTQCNLIELKLKDNLK